MTTQSAVIGDPNYRAVLNHGFVGLIDSMGTDTAIVQAARVSYGAGTKTVNEDRGLIRYLLRHQHTTPFEMAELKFHVRAPILVIRQWFRHRTASINEESARYSEMTDEFYLPDPQFIQPQSSDNKQGRAGDLSATNKEGVLWMMDAAYDHTYQVYQTLLGDKVGRNTEHPGFDVIYDPYSENNPLLTPEFDGVARELARAVMPVGAYSEFYWKLNLHNFMNFVRLRADAHAQYEIRVFADAMLDLVRPLFPACMEAFDDYVQGAVKLSRMEAEWVRELLTQTEAASPRDALALALDDAGSLKALGVVRGMSVREVRDFADRFGLADVLSGAGAVSALVS